MYARRSAIPRALWGAALLVVVGCASEVSLRDLADARPGPPTATPAPTHDWAERSPGQDPGGAFHIREDRISGARIERFRVGGGSRSPIADYLFVVDNSVSMQGVIAQVQRGFAELADELPFDAEARLAVMDTIPERSDEPGRPHRSVFSGHRVTLAPGFGRLVDRTTIDVWRHMGGPKAAERFPLDGCHPWFAVDAHQAQGAPCLVAHTQLHLLRTRVEAGLVAVADAIHAGGVFRPGAVANVVFVSDTHGPGASPDLHPRVQDLKDRQPTGLELAELAHATHDLAGFRVHAVAPGSHCTDEDWSWQGPTYFRAAEATGGVTLDLCTAEPDDFVDLVRRIAVTGAVPTRPVVATGRPIGRIDRVTVDGVPAPVRHGERTVDLGELPGGVAEVEVRYTPVKRTPAVPDGPAKSPHKPARPVATPRATGLVPMPEVTADPRTR